MHVTRAATAGAEPGAASVLADPAPAPSGSVTRRFWRVPLVAVAAAVFAFMASFVLGPVYEAQTRLLVHTDDTTFLSSNGDTITNNGEGGSGVLIDTTMAKAIEDTEAALTGNETIAPEIVNQLDLGVAPKPTTSLVGHLKNLVKDVYVEGKAYLVHGTYHKLSPYQQAVQNVQGGLTASQLSDSYLIEVDAAGSSPTQADAIDNTAANDLVALANQEFQDDVAGAVTSLAGEMQRASAAEQGAANALSSFAAAHKLSTATLDDGLANATPFSAGTTLQAELADTQAQVAGAKAQLKTDESALAATPQTSASTQQVQTGRSTTQVKQTQDNPTYQQLELSVAADKAKVASLRATVAQLSRELAPGIVPANLPVALQGRYAALEGTYQTSSQSFDRAQSAYEQALANQASDPAQMSRVDTAVASSYPVSPKRYLFLGFGLLLGMVGGFLLSARAAHRRGETLFTIDDDDLLPVPVPATTPVAARTVGVRQEEPVIVMEGGVVTKRVRLGEFELYRAAGSGVSAAQTWTAPAENRNGHLSDGEVES